MSTDNKKSAQINADISIKNTKSNIRYADQSIHSADHSNSNKHQLTKSVKNTMKMRNAISLWQAEVAPTSQEDMKPHEKIFSTSKYNVELEFLGTVDDKQVEEEIIAILKSQFIRRTIQTTNNEHF